MERYPKNFNETSAMIIDSRPMFRTGLSSGLLEIEKIVNVHEFSHYKDVAEIKSEIIFLFGGDLTDIEILMHIRNLRKANTNSKIILYGCRHTLNSLLSFFHESLNGYLPENFGNTELEDCLRHLESSKLYLNNEAAYHILLPKLSCKSKKTSLSSLENKVAQHLLKGLSTSKIADLMDRRPSTISTVKANIFKKTKVDNVIDLAKIMII